MTTYFYNTIYYKELQKSIYMFLISPPVKISICISLSSFLPFGKTYLLPHAVPADSAVQAVRLHQAGTTCGAAKVFAALGYNQKISS